MKLTRILFSNAVLLLLAAMSFAQGREQPVFFSKGQFKTGSNVNEPMLKSNLLRTAAFGEQYYLLVQFSELPSPALRQHLRGLGLTLHGYIPGNAYLATVSKKFDFALAGSFQITSFNAVPAAYKLDPGLSGRGKKENDTKIAVSFFPSIDRQLVLQQLRQLGALIQPTKYDQESLVFIQAGQHILDSLAALPFVTGLRYQSIQDKPLNYNSIAAHGISGLNAVSGKNLNGEGVTIGIGDNADISTHVDFSGRLINRSPWVPANHGTHVAGTAAGAGILNIKNHGVAPRAILINQYFSDIITNTPTYVHDNNMVVTNNSYYTGQDGCTGTGEYDALSSYADEQLGGYPQVLHVVASGNDGVYTCSPYPAAYGTIKSGWQAAKNVLTVGAINAENYSIANFSSRGPVLDGRLKPEITAAGWAVTSTATYNNYGINSGTSMASPVVTGAISLMCQRYRQKNGGADPRGSLMKAILCNTAEDLGNPGPDYTFGFGMLNARRAVEAIDSSRYFINEVANAGSAAHMITIPANTRQVKIMLYWTDSAAAINAGKALVADLDLSVTAPGGILHRPLVLNPLPGSVSNIAVQGVDHVNNIEQVVIDNPSAGNLLIQVAGFTVPFGSQEYVISYEILSPGISVEYPSGGEKLVPGEAENIRWSAPGNEGNGFTVQYSIDNGANWTTIDDNVPGNARKYLWTVPSASTNRALVRVSRNGSTLAGQTNAGFTIMGMPVITAGNICKGAVQLTWNAVAAANSYDILQLSGDTMKLIGNTTATSFIIKGLNPDQLSWFGVAAKNGAATGRRSISVSSLPGTGPCSLPTFNNDLEVDSLLEPNTARQGYANAGNAVKPVKILIRNLGSIPVSGPFNVSYSYGSTVVTEVINPLIAAGATYVYSFTTPFLVNPAGFSYGFKSWVSLAPDPNHLNDTAYKTVKYINNDPITSLPLLENFESMEVADFIKSEMAVGGNKRLDFTSSTGRGRARTFVNTGFAYKGSHAMTLDQTPYSDSSNTDSLTISYNLSGYSSKQLRMDFYYMNHGQVAAPGNAVWIRGSENSAWLKAYDLFDNQAPTGNWKRAVININEVLDKAVPAQESSSTFQVRIGEEGKTSANSARSTRDIDDGYSFDELSLVEASNDVGLISIISPGAGDCSLSAANPVRIRIKNYNNTALVNLPVSYQVNGGPVITENIPSIGANQTLDYLFAQTADLSAFTDYAFNAWVKYPADNYAVNDSISGFSVHNSPVISSYPYLQDFENNDGFFYARGINSSWQYGEPTKTIINKAASGAKLWTTNLAGNYNNAEASFLYSPCFDLHGLGQPVLSFSHLFLTELNYDFSWVEYTTDGVSWKKLGAANNGTNWYDDTTRLAWNGGNSRWHVASIDLPVTATIIRLRFALSSDAGVVSEGVGIDDIHIFDKFSIYTGAPVTGISQVVSGNNWVHFSSGGKRIVSVNANGSDLGSTTVQVHPYTGSVRSSNNQYYANRNIVVRSAKPVTGSIGIRFYFTEAEAQNFVDAEGCNSCSKPLDPYETGITQYSGNTSDENGVLTDDSAGYFQYISPAQTAVIPYDNGYYAAFTVTGLSEFWLSAGNIKPPGTGACPGDDLVLTAAFEGNVYQWQENRGAGYVNIVDGPMYAGSKTASLKLNDLPSSFAGYRYRCLVDGLVAFENALVFTNTWKGTTNNNWFLASNWSCGAVPDQYTDAVVPSGLLNYPLVNANTTVKSLSVHPGAALTIGSGVQVLLSGK